MNTRKTFLGRLGSTLGLLILGGPRKLYAALRRPTLTEALADGEWHDVWWLEVPIKIAPNPYSDTGRLCADLLIDSVFVDGQAVRWRLEEQPPNGISVGGQQAYFGDDPGEIRIYTSLERVKRYGLWSYRGQWRKEVEHNRTAVEQRRGSRFVRAQSLPQDAPAGTVLGVS